MTPTGNPYPCYCLITQESVIQTHQSLDPNDLADLPSETGDLRYPNPLVSSAVARGSSVWAEEPKIKYLCTITRESWSPHLEVIVNEKEKKRSRYQRKYLERTKGSKRGSHYHRRAFIVPTSETHVLTKRSVGLPYILSRYFIIYLASFKLLIYQYVLCYGSVRLTVS